MKIAVFGACGKMGEGIAQLLLQVYPFKKVPYHLAFIDSDPSILQKQKTLRSALKTFSEKNINQLRSHFSEDETLVSNEDIIQFFIQYAIDHATFSTHLEEAKDAELIFEAIVEDLDAKVKLFKEINNSNALFLTNTSAIPIKLLTSKSGLENRLIGFHFYNPVVHNPMMEIVAPDALIERADHLAKELHRTSVHAGDVPGFIGNGHFIRELAFAKNLVDEKKSTPQEIDQILETELARPFGVFKLANFIGLPTVKLIAKAMNIHLTELPEIKGPYKPHKIEIKDVTHPLALAFLDHSRYLSKLLVETKAAKSTNDVETVLKVGFHYGIV